MASHSPDSTTAEPDRITFEVDGLERRDGQLVVSGRWYGVRGRRFVRPTLTLVVRSSGAGLRALADLEHKPWAAQDGELWTAAFPLEVALRDADQIELSVAPDIMVTLDPRGGRTRSGGRAAPRAKEARAPRIREAPPRRPSVAERTRELEQLRTSLQAAESAHERERRRRETLERAVEVERTEGLRLRSEVARLAAQLDLAEAARRELAETTSELDSSRAQIRDATQALTDARAQTAGAERRIEELQRTLEQERVEAERAFEQERADTERVRRELADAEDAVRRLAQDRPRSAQDRPRPNEPSDRTDEAQAPSGDGQSREAGSRRAPTPAPTRGEEASARLSRSERPPERELEPMSARLRALNKLEAGHSQWADRPLNPSLRSSRTWIVRGLAVIVILVVIAAVILVIQSTVS